MSVVDELNAQLEQLMASGAIGGSAESKPEETPPVVASEENAEKPDKTNEKETKAEKRIRKLSQEKKELQSRLEAIEKQFTSRTQQLESEFNRLAAEAKVNQNLLSHNKTLAERQAEERKLAQMTPMQRWEYENKKREEGLQRSAEEIAQRRVEELFKAQEEARKQQEAQLEKQRLIQMLEEQSTKVASKLVEGFDEKSAAELHRSLTPWVSVASAAFQMTPEQAMTELSKTFDKYFRAKVKAMTAQTKAKVEKNQSVAAPVRSVGKEATTSDPITQLVQNFSKAEVESVVGSGNYIAAMLNPKKAALALKTLTERKSKGK